MCVQVFKQKSDALPPWNDVWAWQRDVNVSFSFQKTHFTAAAAHLAHVHLVSVFACSRAICGEDSCAIAIGITVDQTDGIIQGVRLENNQHRPEDLLSVALHFTL